MASEKLVLAPSTILRVLSGIAILLVIASFSGQLIAHLTGHPTVFGFVPLFNVNNEANFPTYFSAILLLIAAVLLTVISLFEKEPEKYQITHWRILSFIFFSMSIDEFITFHERLSEPTQRLLGIGTQGIFYYAWVIPGMIIVLIIGLFYLKFWCSLKKKTRNTFLISAVVYLAGCIGMELVSSSHVSIHGVNNLTYSLLNTIEESLEMAGIILFIWGLMTYIAENIKEINIHFNTGKGG